jgi:hypothetical protein
MLLCQLAQAKSLREISGGLSSALGKLRHLGVKSAPEVAVSLWISNERSPYLNNCVTTSLIPNFEFI